MEDRMRTMTMRIHQTEEMVTNLNQKITKGFQPSTEQPTGSNNNPEGGEEALDVSA